MCVGLLVTQNPVDGLLLRIIHICQSSYDLSDVVWLRGQTSCREGREKSVEFEDYVWPTIRRHFPEHKGWIIHQERPLIDGTRVDYALWRRKYGKNGRTVVEAKNVKQLTRRHIDQLDHYARRYKASYRLVVVCSKTLVDQSVREYAYDLDIKIVRTRF